MSQNTVLERRVLEAGKTFIRQDEENARAYVIQTGEVRSFIVQDGEKIEIARLGPGTIIDELCLLIDKPGNVSYEAITSVTVATISRDDFQKKLSKADKTVTTILDHVVKKLTEYQNAERESAVKKADYGDLSRLLVKGLIKDLSPEKKLDYESAMLPHIDGLIKSLEELKAANKAKKNAE